MSGGTFETNANAITVAGSIEYYGGIFEHESGAVTLDGTATDSILQTDGMTFNNIEITGSGKWAMYSGIDLDTSLLITAGEMTVHASVESLEFDGTVAIGPAGTFTGGTTELVTHAGDLETTTGAQYTATSYVTRITEDIDLATSTFTANSGTVMFTSDDTANTITSNSEAFNNVDLGEGLIGYWKLDEAAAPYVDSSGYGNAMAIIGDPVSSSSVPTPFKVFNGGSVEFDSNDRLSVGDLPLWNTGSGCSLSLWFKTTTNQSTKTFFTFNRNYLVLYSNSAQVSYLAQTEAGAVQASYNTGTAGYFADDVWRHVVGVYDRYASDGNRLKLYMNGVLVASEVGNDYDVMDWTYGVRFGINFTGSLDDGRVYNRALSVVEVSVMAKAKFMKLRQYLHPL